MQRIRVLNVGLPAILATTLMAGVSLPALAGEVTQQRLENAASEPQNWLLPYSNYEGHMFSRLDQINRDTVSNLKVAFALPMASALSGNPELNMMNHGLVDDGYLFIDDGRGGIYKIDLTSNDTAAVMWKADAAVSADESNRTRGMALWGNAVYHNLTDGRVVAVDRDSGEFLWDQQIARVDHPKGSGLNLKGEYFDAAPLPVDGKILVGQSYGDGLTRGWLAAVNADTGAEMWRTYMVPGPGEPGHETWKDSNEVWKIGGGGLWTTGTYDPEQKLTIWGTGNAQPMFDPEYRPGDNLFTVSAVAMDVNDGAIKWYFQYSPNENYDYDENGVHQIYTVDVGGQQRRIVGHWGRNGFHYRLDAVTGQFIDASQYVETVNWTAGIDPKTGKPVEYDPALDVQTYIPATRMLRGDGPETFCPHLTGGIRWQAVAFNPDKARSFQSSKDGCATVQIAESTRLPDGMIDPAGPGGIRGRVGGAISVGEHGLVSSVDVRTNQQVASATYKYSNESGTLATAGGLVFTVWLDGRVVALNDDTLEEVWHFNAGAASKAPPFTFAVNGRQYVAVVTGGGRRAAAYTPAFPDAVNWVNGPVLYFFAL